MTDVWTTLAEVVIRVDDHSQSTKSLKCFLSRLCWRKNSSYSCFGSWKLFPPPQGSLLREKAWILYLLNNFRPIICKCTNSKRWRNKFPGKKGIHILLRTQARRLIFIIGYWLVHSFQNDLRYTHSYNVYLFFLHFYWFCNRTFRRHHAHIKDKFKIPLVSSS